MWALCKLPLINAHKQCDSGTGVLEAAFTYAQKLLQCTELATSEIKPDSVFANLPVAVHSDRYALTLPPPFNAAHQPEVFSADVWDDRVIDAVGVLTAFRDHRIRIHFLDRTVVELDAKRTVAHVVSFSAQDMWVPLHSRDTATQGNPSPLDYITLDARFVIDAAFARWASYIGYALSYAKWIFLTSAERSRVVQSIRIQHALTAVEADANQRLMYLMSKDLITSAPALEQVEEDKLEHMTVSQTLHTIDSLLSKMGSTLSVGATR